MSVRAGKECGDTSAKTTGRNLTSDGTKFNKGRSLLGVSFSLPWRSTSGSGSTWRGVVLIFHAAVHEWELVNLSGVILFLGAVVHEGDPVNLVGSVSLFGHKVKT